MVERVAKAIAEVVDRRTSGDYDIEGEIAEECSRAAIEAMRNPNHAMEDAGWAHMGTAPAPYTVKRRGDGHVYVDLYSGFCRKSVGFSSWKQRCTP